MSRVVIVSNRVADLEKTAQAGGVAVAIADILKQQSCLWFGWNGKLVSEPQPPPRIVKRRRGAPVVTVPLSAAEHEDYYLGYANSVLWPVFHGRLDLAKFEAGYFRAYAGVNTRFAQILKPQLRPDDVIWVHDYHFIPFALELRKLGVENPIGFFLHIPFPPAQWFLAVPEHKELARALAAYDLVGLQTKADVRNMLDYLQNHVNARIIPDGRVRAFDRIVSIESLPVGISVEDFVGTEPRAQRELEAGMMQIVGVDRLDYSKGLPQKFRAFGQFLDTFPEYRGRAVLTQIAPPSRETVDAYHDVRKQLEELSGSINGRYGELDWVPIHYIRRSVPRKRLSSVYRTSRIGLITPLRDGMNLVAKEYVASQSPADPGVLILSQFAGAAEDLHQALIINPYNIEETAKAIHTAATMGLEERRSRHDALMATITRQSAAAWGRAFLSKLSRSSAMDDAMDMYSYHARARKLRADAVGPQAETGLAQVARETKSKVRPVAAKCVRSPIS